jgi:hypothetical protein
MNDLERRRYNMLVRVRDFGAENITDFPSDTIGNTNFGIVNTVVDELETQSATQTSGITKQHTSSKASIRSELRQNLRAINITAQSMSVDNPSLIEIFRMPRIDNDQQLLAKARSFVTEANLLKNQFVAFGMSDNFINDLEADITSFEQVMTEQGTSIDTRVGATAAIDDAIDRGLKAVKRLNAVVRNKYANNPAKFAAWISASHVERPPRKKKENPPTPPTT